MMAAIAGGQRGRGVIAPTGLRFIELRVGEKFSLSPGGAIYYRSGSANYRDWPARGRERGINPWDRVYPK